MSDRIYYCFCEDNCKFETMTKEQIIAAIEQAAAGETVVDPDAAYITKVKEQNTGAYVTFWVGTEEQYNAIAEKDKNCIYIVTDCMSTAETAQELRDFMVTDASLSVEGKAADAKATGEALAGKAPAIESEDYVGCYYRIVNGVTEWLNPPMETGISYRTTERYGGKPVYAKLVDIGYLPNASKKTVSYEDNTARPFLVVGVDSQGNSLPTAYSSNGTDITSLVTIMADGNEIFIYSKSDKSALTATVLVKYTRSTD